MGCWSILRALWEEPEERVEPGAERFANSGGVDVPRFLGRYFHVKVHITSFIVCQGGRS